MLLEPRRVTDTVTVLGLWYSVTGAKELQIETVLGLWYSVTGAKESQTETVLGLWYSVTGAKETWCCGYWSQGCGGLWTGRQR